MLSITEKQKLVNDVGYHWIASQQMTLAEWALIPPNPIQRDTEKRARTAKHLAIFNPAHLRAAMCLLPDGRRFKADAHTRAYMWINGLTDGLPDRIVMNIDIYSCNDMEAVRALYRTFDNRAAVDTAQDDLFGVVSEAGLKFQSPMMCAYRFGSAVKRLYAITNGYAGADWSDQKFTHKVVNYFRNELVALDDVAPKHKDFVTPIIMAAILTFMKDGEEAAEFWKRYVANSGTKDARGCDGVQAMRNLLAWIREHKRHGNQHDFDQLGRAINAYQMYRGRNRYEGKSGVPHKKTKTETDAFIAAAVKAKEGRRQ